MITSVLLGDVASSGSVGSRADGRVDFEDLSAWSLGYWTIRPATMTTADGYRRKYDIGPTLDGTPYSLPMADGIINFEDLMIMALMYGTNGTIPLPKTVNNGSAYLTLETGGASQDGTTIQAILHGTVTDLHGLAIRLPGVADRLIGILPGMLLNSLTPAPIMFSRSVGQDVEVHIATGAGHAIPANGELFTVRLRSPGPITLELNDARDGSNSSVVTTGLDGGGTERPTPFALEQNYPNPFNPSTTISYTLPATTQVVIRIFNVLGAEVATLVEGQQSAGVHHAVFDASGLPSGVYLCRMQAGDFTASRKLLLMR
jgi:hypothetical protein